MVLVDKLVFACPMEESELNAVTAWEFKPFFRRINRWLVQYYSFCILVAVIIIPVWFLNGLEDDKYVATEDGMCHVNGVPAEYPLNTSLPKYCASLTSQKEAEGWMLSPIQKHAHRYGSWFQAAIWAHVILGHVISGSVVANICLRLAGFGQDSSHSCVRTRKLLFGCIHYYGVLLPWTLNAVVALYLALMRMLTLGINAAKWRWFFSVGFFILFYFLVLIMFSSLTLALYQPSDAYTTMELYVERLARYSVQCMFLLLIPVIFMINFKNGMALELGLAEDEVIIISVVSCFILEPMYNSFMLIDGHDHRLYARSLSSMTIYFLSVMTLSINITYKYDSRFTAFSIVVWAMIYAAAIAYAHREIGKWERHGKRK